MGVRTEQGVSRRLADIRDRPESAWEEARQ
ncbi:hypothetical protein KIPE111705_12160 [Kibdelosporangium persicum]